MQPSETSAFPPVTPKLRLEAGPQHRFGQPSARVSSPNCRI